MKINIAALRAALVAAFFIACGTLALAQTNPGQAPCSIAKGCTGAATASGARTSLGLAIGSNVEAWDADLDALAALNSTGILARVGTASYALRTLGAGTGLLWTNGNGVSGAPSIALDINALTQDTSPDITNDFFPSYDASATAHKKVTLSSIRTALGLVVGTGVEAWDADLDALAALNSTGFAVRTASNTWTQRTFAAATGLAVSNGDGVAGAPSYSLSINSLTEDTSPDAANDFLLSYDTSATAHKKVKPSSLFASPTFTGDPKAPTPSVDDNDTSIPTTAWVIGQLSQAGDGMPAMDGTAARGSSIHGARADHVHPTDTTRAPAARNVSTGAGLSGGGDLSADRTLKVSRPVNPQTGTSYTVLSTDQAKLVTFSNGSSVAVTLPVASTFGANWEFDVLNLGAGTVTITPTTSTVNGAANLVLATGQGAHIFSDGTNYFAQAGAGSGGGSGVTSVICNGSTVTITISGNCLGRETLTGNRTLYVRTAPVNVTSITNASPAVVNATAHGLSINDPVVFGTSGTLPTGLTPGTIYYVISAGFGSNAFEVSTSLGGAAVNTSGAGSGTHSFQTGNDANNGLAQTRAGAFLTVQQAWTAILKLDLAGFSVTVQLADSTYNSGLSISSPSIGGNVTFQGNNSTPANVLISFSGIPVSNNSPGFQLSVRDFKVVSSGSNCIAAGSGAYISIGNIDFGACSDTQLRAESGAYISIDGNYKITGSAGRHWVASMGGKINGNTKTITLTGTPAFSNFAALETGGVINFFSPTFSGSATGARYSISSGGMINLYGAGTSALPGNASGTGGTTTGNGFYN